MYIQNLNFPPSLPSLSASFLLLLHSILPSSSKAYLIQILIYLTSISNSISETKLFGALHIRKWNCGRPFHQVFCFSSSSEHKRGLHFQLLEIKGCTHIHNLLWPTRCAEKWLKSPCVNLRVRFSLSQQIWWTQICSRGGQSNHWV